MPTGIYLRSSVLARFWDKVEVVDSGCWEWRGGLATNGYGRFNLGNGKSAPAHRITYNLFKGDIPEGLEPDHLCRNRKCVNPDHIEAVTRRENIMRGLLPATNRNLQLSKTHCPQGHSYDEINTYIDSRGYRHCRMCNRPTGRRNRIKRRVVKCY